MDPTNSGSFKAGRMAPTGSYLIKEDARACVSSDTQACFSYTSFLFLSAHASLTSEMLKVIRIGNSASQLSVFSKIISFNRFDILEAMSEKWHGHLVHAYHGRLVRGKKITKQGQDVPVTLGRDAQAT